MSEYTESAPKSNGDGTPLGVDSSKESTQHTTVEPVGSSPVRWTTPGERIGSGIDKEVNSDGTEQLYAGFGQPPPASALPMPNFPPRNVRKEPVVAPTLEEPARNGTPLSFARVLFILGMLKQDKEEVEDGDEIFVVEENAAKTRFDGTGEFANFFLNMKSSFYSIDYLLCRKGDDGIIRPVALVKLDIWDDWGDERDNDALDGIMCLLYSSETDTVSRTYFNLGNRNDNLLQLKDVEPYDVCFKQQEQDGVGIHPEIEMYSAKTFRHHFQDPGNYMCKWFPENVERSKFAFLNDEQEEPTSVE